MKDRFVVTRVLGTVDLDTPELREQNKKKMRLVAGGAYPYAIREMMKQCGHGILSSSNDPQEKEDAKLLICYSWWSRALEGGIPKRYFEAFMLDHLKHLDGDPGINLVKWQKYG